MEDKGDIYGNYVYNNEVSANFIPIFKREAAKKNGGKKKFITNNHFGIFVYYLYTENVRACLGEH